MKRVICFLLTVFLFFFVESAFAAKARSITSEADSTHHSKHLQLHIGNINCHATGNYIKTRIKADSNKVIGHLEQADEFVLLEMQEGWARIEVTFADKSSPDSWIGMTGWVNADYIDCDCSWSDYLNQTFISHFEIIDDYRCKVNHLRVRNAPNGSKVLGHIEQEDYFRITDIDNGWAHIQVEFSGKTCRDSWVGLTGWVSMKYLEKQTNHSDADWKKAYRDYISENNLIKNLKDCAVYWFAYIDNDDIPELIIDSGITAGGCHIITYHNKQVHSVTIGSNGFTWYIERENLVLNSAGQQGSYYDAVYMIDNGKWKQIYHSENYEFPSPNDETQQQLIQTYYIDGIEVNKTEYVQSLSCHFPKNNAIKLTDGISVAYLDNELR